MKCPYRIITTKKPGQAFSEITEQAFAECYGEECPHYRPECKIGNLTRLECCSKSLVEERNSIKEKQTK